MQAPPDAWLAVSAEFDPGVVDLAAPAVSYSQGVMRDMTESSPIPKPRSGQDSGDDSSKSLGIWSCTALVIGNMIGSGFFIAPAALAPYGTVAIFGWGVMAAGAVCLGLVVAHLVTSARTQESSQGSVIESTFTRAPQR